MSRLLKRVRIGRYAIPILLLATLAIGTVAAAAYVILTWTMTLTVSAHPRVHFWNGSTEANTMDIEMNIFPDIVTIDEDASWDIRSNDTGNMYIRVSSMDTVEVAKVNITAYETDPASPLFSLVWTGPTSSWSTTIGTGNDVDYNLWIEVTGAGTATGPETTITVEMKVESP
jgi:hypothetical protein